MPALDALTAKAICYDALFNPDWAPFADRYTSSLRGEVPGTLGQIGYDETGPEFTKRAARMLTLAHTYYVAPNMAALVTAAAESWPEDELIWPEDFPTQQGWLWVPGGITAVDIRGRLLRTSAISWSVRAGGVDIICWADKYVADPLSYRSEPGWDKLPRFTPWHVGRITFGHPAPTAIVLGTILPPEVADSIEVTEHDGQISMFIPEGWSREEMTPHIGVAVEVAWLVSALRIMAQPLATHERVGIPARVRKSLARHARRVKETAVTVVDFRRREGMEGSSGTRVYTHQWLRRGHWRRQWMGSERLGNRRQVRIWIHPAICGPADKPLLLREHVNALIR